MGAGCQEIRGLKPSIAPNDFGVGGRLRLNPSPLANNLVTHNYVMKHHKNPKGQFFGPFLESFCMPGPRLQDRGAFVQDFTLCS